MGHQLSKLKDILALFKVCIADVNTNVGQKTTEQFCSEYGKESAFFMECDVRNESNFEGTECVIRIFPVSVSKLHMENVGNIWFLILKNNTFYSGKLTYTELSSAVHTHMRIFLKLSCDLQSARWVVA